MKVWGKNDKTEEPTMSLPLHLSPAKAVGPSQLSPEAWGDSELLTALLQGDRLAASVLYDRVRPAIDATLRRILHHRGPDFEDHAQSTFERILRALAQGRFEGRSSLKTWASAIATHVALDALRRAQRERPRSQMLPDEALFGSGENTDKKLESLAELRRVQGVLTGMKPELAETLILHDVLGYQLNEIGELTDSSPSATQSRLHRARKEFRRRAERTINRRRP